MPIELKQLNSGHVLEVHLTGKLIKDDYERFVPAVERLVQHKKKISLLVEMEDFRGWSPGALWEDSKFALHHFRDIDRLAIVGEKRWEEAMAAFCKPFTSAKVRYFDHSQSGEACQWVQDKQDKPSTSTPINAAQQSDAVASSDEIARLAYQHFEREGRPHGRDQHHWFAAETELRARRQAKTALASAKRTSLTAPAKQNRRPRSQLG